MFVKYFTLGMLGLFSILLQGCADNVQHVQTHVINESKPKLTIPEYPELKLKNVEFSIIKNDKIYYCLDIGNYKNLSEDTLIIQNYLKYLKNVIKAYQDYYEPDKETK